MARSFTHIKSVRPTDHKVKSSDFPVKTFRTLSFSSRLLGKISRHGDVMVRTVETFSQMAAVQTFGKHWQCCETLREIS